MEFTRKAQKCNHPTPFSLFFSNESHVHLWLQSSFNVHSFIFTYWEVILYVYCSTLTPCLVQASKSLEASSVSPQATYYKKSSEFQFCLQQLNSSHNWPLQLLHQHQHEKIWYSVCLLFVLKIFIFILFLSQYYHHHHIISCLCVHVFSWCTSNHAS